LVVLEQHVVLFIKGKLLVAPPLALLLAHLLVAVLPALSLTILIRLKGAAAAAAGRSSSSSSRSA
jgi:hypothetical protein